MLQFEALSNQMRAVVWGCMLLKKLHAVNPPAPQSSPGKTNSGPIIVDSQINPFAKHATRSQSTLSCHARTRLARAIQNFY
jgi:hypothetical protein